MEEITEHDTNYALMKQIDNGLELQSNYGEILLTKEEEITLKSFLKNLLNQRVHED